MRVYITAPDVKLPASVDARLSYVPRQDSDFPSIHTRGTKCTPNYTFT